MAASQLIDLVQSSGFETQLGFSDFTDQLSSFWSVILGVLGATVIAVKVYAMSPISCYVSTTFGGIGQESFVENYCFAQGSVSIRHKTVESSNFPQTLEEWKEFKRTGLVTYYQWVPLFLSFIALLPFLVGTTWKVFYTRRAGADYQNLLDTAKKAQSESGEERTKKIESIANCIDDCMTQGREYRQSRFARFKTSVFRKLRFGFFSKRFGTRITFFYLMTKVAYLASHMAILVAMYSFLNMGPEYRFFGFKVLVNLMNGRYWEETGIFPRVTYCHVPIKHNTLNHLFAQCVLPVNLLNEIVFVILWFWHFFCAAFMLASLVVWTYRSWSGSDKEDFVKKSLILSGIVDNATSEEMRCKVHMFTKHYLQHDGLFLLRMLHSNVGSGVTMEVVAVLWNKFLKIKDVHDLARRHYGKKSSGRLPPLENVVVHPTDSGHVRRDEEPTDTLMKNDNMNLGYLDSNGKRQR